jgi:predicted  nucleic acid-binding Zn-ribbon protein
MGLQEESWDLEMQASAHSTWPQQECPAPLLQGAACGSKEDPNSLRRARIEGCGWGLLGRLSSEDTVPMTSSSRAHGTRVSQLTNGQLPARKGQTIWRSAQGREGHQLRFRGALLPLDEGHEEEEEKALPQEPSSLEYRGQSDRKVPAGREMHFSPGDRGPPWFSRWAAATDRGEATCTPQPLSTGQDGCALQIDAFEREVEACFQQLSILELGSRSLWTSTMAGESWSFPDTQQDGKEGICLQLAWASQGLNACSTEDAKPSECSKGVSLEKTMTLDTTEVLPEMVPNRGKASQGPAEPGRNELSLRWGALERARGRFQQLLANLKKERSQVLRDNAKLQGDQKRCHHKVCDLEEERARDATKICRLEQANHTLGAELAGLERERDQCLRAISHLEDCNGKSFSKILELEEENEKLRLDLGQLQKAMSESIRKAGGHMEGVTLENRELRGLMSELGVSYKKLMKEVVLGLEDMVRTLRGENQHLLCRVQALEQEVTLKMSRDVGWMVGGGQHVQGDTKMAGDKMCSEDKEVQVTPLSGLPVEEEAGVTGRQTGLASDLEGSRCGTDSTTSSLVWRDAKESSVLQENFVAGRKGAQKEKMRLGCWMDQGEALRFLSPDSQVS